MGFKFDQKPALPKSIVPVESSLRLARPITSSKVHLPPSNSSNFIVGEAQPIESTEHLLTPFLSGNDKIPH